MTLPEIERFEETARLRVGVGDLSGPVGDYLGAMERSSHVVRFLLGPQLLALLRMAARRPTTRQEKQSVRESLLKAGFDRGKDASRFVAAVDDLSVLETEQAVGSVWALFAGETEGGCAFGSAVRLAIVAPLSGGRIRLDPKGSDPVYLGFRNGIAAAQEWLASRDPRPLDGPLLARFFSAEGHLEWSSKGKLSGESLGLASAIAMASAMLGLPVPTDLAATGRVTSRGEVLPVGGMREKLQAALDKGLRVIGPDNVSSLDEALSSVFGENAVEKALAEHVQKSAPPSSRNRLGAEVDRVMAPKVLLSWVGRADPVGSGLDENRRPLPVSEEGPLLSCAREVRPAVIYLFHTTLGRENDFREKAATVKEALESADPAVSVVPVPFDALIDPTDYTELLPALKAVALRVVAENPGAAFFANVSSGAPQMETAWHLLKERGILPRPTLLRVRESRFQGDGSRVAAVELPVL